jgi:hypothetical protein
MQPEEFQQSSNRERGTVTLDLRLQNESNEGREHRLRENRLGHRSRRQNESSEDRERRLAIDRERDRRRRENEYVY